MKKTFPWREICTKIRHCCKWQNTYKRILLSLFEAAAVLRDQLCDLAASYLCLCFHFGFCCVFGFEAHFLKPAVQNFFQNFSPSSAENNYKNTADTCFMMASHSSENIRTNFQIGVIRINWPHIVNLSGYFLPWNKILKLYILTVLQQQLISHYPCRLLWNAFWDTLVTAFGITCLPVW